LATIKEACSWYDIKSLVNTTLSLSQEFIWREISHLFTQPLKLIPEQVHISKYINDGILSNNLAHLICQEVSKNLCISFVLKEDGFLYILILSSRLLLLFFQNLPNHQLKITSSLNYIVEKLSVNFPVLLDWVTYGFEIFVRWQDCITHHLFDCLLSLESHVAHFHPDLQKVKLFDHLQINLILVLVGPIVWDQFFFRFLRKLSNNATFVTLTQTRLRFFEMLLFTIILCFGFLQNNLTCCTFFTVCSFQMYN